MEKNGVFFGLIVSLLAIRSPRDAIAKGLGFFLAINSVALAIELALNGQLSMSFWVNTLATLLTALPFMVLVFAVVTRLDRLLQRLVELATTDMLTGLPNRRAFLSQGAAALSRSDRGVLFIIDADHFKTINDKYGHAVGDLCLQAIADHLRRVLRTGDVVGRVGGEEFAAYLPDARVEHATEIGQRLTGAIEVQIEGGGVSLSFTMSVGAAETRPDGTLEHLLKLADMALYQAKRDGRARLVFWRDGVDHAA